MATGRGGGGRRERGQRSAPCTVIPTHTNTPSCEGGQGVQREGAYKKRVAGRVALMQSGWFTCLPPCKGGWVHLTTVM